MADLSEAQAAVNQLNPGLYGSTVIGVTVAAWFADRKCKFPVSDLKGWTFSAVQRKGKAILFEFNNPGFGRRFMLSRLGMTGHWLFDAADRPHCVVSFDLSSPQGLETLSYHDKRRFGTLEVGDSPRIGPQSLGPDPLSPAFGPEWVYAVARRHGAPVKAILLRQEYFPGVGNWIATEALFRAAVPPSLPGAAMTPAQAERLASALMLTARNGITRGGATLRDWRTPDGASGRAQEDFEVYGREGRPCRECGTVIVKAKIDGRPSFHCPRCQDGHEAPEVTEAFVAEVIKATGADLEP